jgi:hypothetical protein
MPQVSGKRVLGVLCAIAAASACANAPAASAARSGPKLVAPANNATVTSVPPFEWKAVRRAAQYEFQLSADPQFESIVLGQGRGSFQTRNTFGTIDETIPNGNYYWRVRWINKGDNASRWSAVRTLRKNWNQAPELVEPINGQAIDYPLTPLILRWLPVRGAYKYNLWIGTDPTLASVDAPVETSGTVFSPPKALAQGRYYWAVAPLDAQKHVGTRSTVRSFEWRWPSSTAVQALDLNDDARVFDPQFTWNPVPGAARYEVEINPSEDFAVGSKVCCTEDVIGTSVSPKDVLPNNTYYWRVRAVDLDRQAGQWNAGTPFRKTFDDVAPTVPDLHMRDNVGDPATDVDLTTPALLDMNHPIVRWDPVPGASSYDLQVAPHVEISPGVFACDWSAPVWEGPTAATAWTPLSRKAPPATPVPGAPTPSSDGRELFTSGESYCVRVRASNEVVSEWTYLNGFGGPAFRYVAAAPGGHTAGPSFTMPSAAYREPVTGFLTTRLPLFTWDPVAGAESYYVVVAKDAAFTHVLDVALTNHPMYSPRKRAALQTYPDETTSYYWAVMPAQQENGEGFFSQPSQNFPRPFEKRSVPPTLMAPAEGEDILRQPVFRWTAAESAHDYQMQVASDPSFSKLLDDVKTAATSHTSEETYPADTVLYWRVRATDARDVGLTWSAVGTFRRRLAIPTLNASNPTSVETIPAFRWDPVQGATSYDMHVEQANGTTRDFTLRGTTFTPIIWYGTGTWRWQVRANFPGKSFREVQGGYTAPQPVIRHIATPSNPRAINRERHILLRWGPSAMAKSYRVQISTSDSFTRIVDRETTDHTSWAPELTQSDFLNGGKFYWRVAALDEGGNLGGWQVAQLRTRRGFALSASGFVRRRVPSVVRVRVRDGKSRGVRDVKIVVTGAGVRKRVRRTNREGRVEFKVRARRRGKLTIRASKRRYRTATTTVPVR